MDELEKILEESLKLSSSFNEIEKHIQKKIKETNPSLKDIVKFVQEKLDDPTQMNYIGHKLSMLINTKMKEHDKITLKAPKGYFSALIKTADIGYKLKRGELTIIGSTGQYIGSHQTGGTIIVLGNTDAFPSLGKTGGKTIIKGNTGDEPCICMKGGTTIIEGNTGKDACMNMEGGTTIIKGNAGDNACYEKTGGTTIVEGNTGNEACKGMEGGLLVVKGKIESISDNWKKGIIVEKTR